MGLLYHGKCFHQHTCWEGMLGKRMNEWPGKIDWNTRVHVSLLLRSRSRRLSRYVPFML
jgi:hypothetical protein